MVTCFCKSLSLWWILEMYRPDLLPESPTIYVVMLKLLMQICRNVYFLSRWYLLCAVVIASDDENDAESVLPELSDDEDVENERQHRALVVLAGVIPVMDCNCCAVSSGAGSKLGLVWRVSPFHSLSYSPFLFPPLRPFLFHSSPPLSFLFSLLALSSLPSLFSSLKSRSPLFHLGVWERCINSPSWVWGGAPAEIILVHFSLKIWHMGNNFNDFPENQLPKCHRIGMAVLYQISDCYGGRHTPSGATGCNNKHCKGQIMSREGQCIAVRLSMPLQLVNENVLLKVTDAHSGDEVHCSTIFGNW